MEDFGLGGRPSENGEPWLVTMEVHDLPREIGVLCGKPTEDAVMPQEVRERSFGVLVCQAKSERGQKLADPRRMRDEFLALPEDLRQLSLFARRWGFWDEFWCLTHFNPNSQMEQLPDLNCHCILAHKLWAKQAEYRDALSGRAAAWLSRPEARIETRQREYPPYFFAQTSDCKRAIEITITADHLKGAQFGVCARRDCNTIFEFRSGHARKFCTPECAHLMAVRKSRERARKPNTKQRRRGK